MTVRSIPFLAFKAAKELIATDPGYAAEYESPVALWKWLLEDLTVDEATAWLTTGTDSDPDRPIRVGDTVKVRHIGIMKTGEVVDVRKTRCSVKVPLRDGSHRYTHPYISDVRLVVVG